ncbi:Mevalonate kinase [hydrothermal vent metagenome]|uniref:Mevalonate kinase n=1 Tax=hydrothermal vent metagenome TaxID=652676 RepID=A0A3B0WYA1_9ZZZZ
MKTDCSVPAKLILSGEHAVLYQCPALSMAIDLPTHCWTECQPNNTSSLHVELCNFTETHTLSFSEYRQQAQQIEQRYQLFLQNKTTIKTVLTQPIDLIICTLYHFEQIQPLNTGNWSFKIQSETPIGRGLGSSAAVILSLLGSLIKHHSLSISSTELLTLARQVEARQHGKSSGIDPATLIYAGLVRYQTNQPIEPIISPPLNAWLIDTGKPDSSTGECVVAVQSRHQNDSALWQAFRTTTQAIASAIEHQEWQRLQQGITENHQLLTQIGVVPKTIQTFITKLHTQYHAAAKICGAGSLTGKNAGVIICLSKQAPTKLCHTYGYTCRPITLQQQGLTCEFI